MDMAHLIDPTAALIVGGGTLLATTLRAGLGDCRLTLAELAGLRRRRFRTEAVRREAAAFVSQVRQDGLVRARRRPLGDPDLDAALDAVIAARSPAVLLVRYADLRRERISRAGRAARTLAQAADLAPVFGLAGTLVSLSQLGGQGIARGMFMGAISMSVLTTLYGLLLANLLLAPLARAVERRAERDEAARQGIVDWLVAQMAVAAPRTAPGPRAAA